MRTARVRGSGRFFYTTMLDSRTLDCVIPAWSAGIQADMDASGRILANLMDTGDPCRHDGDLHFMFCGSA
jgi:hypothetical protein